MSGSAAYRAGASTTAARHAAAGDLPGVDLEKYLGSSPSTTSRPAESIGPSTAAGGQLRRDDSLGLDRIAARGNDAHGAGGVDAYLGGETEASAVAKYREQIEAITRSSQGHPKNAGRDATGVSAGSSIPVGSSEGGEATGPVSSYSPIDIDDYFDGSEEARARVAAAYSDMAL